MLALGARSGVRKNTTHRNKMKKEIKDGHNGTKIGASNIYIGVISLGNQLRSSLNNSDTDKSFRSNFSTRKAVAPFLNIQSCWADKYGSIDTSIINIGPLVIILWQILGQPHYLS